MPQRWSSVICDYRHASHRRLETNREVVPTTGWGRSMKQQCSHDRDQAPFSVFTAVQHDPGVVHKEKIRAHYSGLAPEWDRWRNRNRYYHRHLEEYLRFVIPAGSSVCELGCDQGDLLAALEPKRGLGIDLSPPLIERARRRHPQLEFQVADCENLSIDEQFDYVVLSNV